VFAATASSGRGAFHADGYLASLENPAGEATALQYDTGLAEGLLLQKTDAGGGLHQYGYDSDGRLVSDSSPTGRTVALTRTESSTGHAVLYTTSEGRKTKHEVSEDSAGVVLRTKTDAFGGVTTTTTAPTGTTTVTYPDGRSLAVTPATSDRFGGVLPMNQKLVVTLPSGLSTTIESDETMVLSDPSDPLSVSLITQTSTIAGQKYTRVIDPAAGTETETSPTGKSVVTTRDDLGRVTAVAYASGAAPLEAAWDAEGRLASVLHGNYEKLYTYDGSGRPTSKRWGSRSLSLVYDDADRVTSATTPSGGLWSFGRDEDGNRVGITFPKGGTHSLTPDASGRLLVYTPQDGVEPVSLTWSADGDLQSVVSASGMAWS